MEIKLNGMGAVVGVVLLGGLFLYRSASMQTELETEALDELKAYLVAEYTGVQAAPLSDALATGQPLDGDAVQAMAENILQSVEVTFSSVEARGFKDARDGGDAVVKVGILVGGGPPPDGESTRYYRMRYRSLTGWKVGARTSAWAYRLKLF